MYILKSYERDIHKIISLGLAHFGLDWNMFNSNFRYLYFWAHTLLTELRLSSSRLLSKLPCRPSHTNHLLSQAKMKVLRPEITWIGRKIQEDPIEASRKRMKLTTKPVCSDGRLICTLIQIPFMYASFQFFHQLSSWSNNSFLWADDLSSFDQVAKLPFTFRCTAYYASLLPILAAIADSFYMKMTSGDQQTDGTATRRHAWYGGEIMKIMIYVLPIMIYFFNSYGAGSSLYNFISNLITIGIMLSSKAMNTFLKKFTRRFKRQIKRAEKNKGSSNRNRKWWKKPKSKKTTKEEIYFI